MLSGIKDDRNGTKIYWDDEGLLPESKDQHHSSQFTALLDLSY